MLARRIARPLRAVTEGVRRIGRFELQEADFPRSHIHEVEVLSSSVQRMRHSLQSFAQYVPVDVVRDLIRAGGVAGLGGNRRIVTVMFCDLQGFTSYAEKVSPETAVDTLTAYFEVFVRAIDKQGGVVDKFLGDGLMALFNAPSTLPAHAAAACAPPCWPTANCQPPAISADTPRLCAPVRSGTRWWAMSGRNSASASPPSAIART